MAEIYSTLTALFTDIADAIREKTGETDLIIADYFPDVIRERLQAAPPPAYLMFSSPNSFTLKVNDTTKHWDGTLEYSTDTSTWSTWDGTTTLSSVTSGSDNVLYLRGTGNTVITGFGDYGPSETYAWVLTGTDIACIGNIENLLDYVTVESGQHPTLAEGCYADMFYGCTSLTQAPALPATTLTAYCYYDMFQNCTSLTKAPALPASTLTRGCYAGMFHGCTGLTQAPALPATTLTDYCYSDMFHGCTSLTQAPALPATTLANYCYQRMFQVCTALTQAPALPATTLTDRCYQNMFYGCTSLTQVPTLPATTLAAGCYDSMFYGCSKIKLSSTQTGEYTVAYRIPSSGTGTTATDALIDMFTSTGGTFTRTPEINTTYYLSNTNTVNPPLGDKLYTFGVTSDIHLRPDNYGHGIDDFNRTLPLLQNLGAEFIGISGDIGYNGNTNELELYQSALNNLATVPVHPVRGNHDKPFTDANWQTYTGFAPNHEMIYNGDVFLFMSMDYVNNTTNAVEVGYATGLAWLKKRLARYKGARIFVFCHYPPSGYSGLADGQYYGWTSTATEDDELVSALLQTKNIILFTGHTHYRLNVEETYDSVNIYRFNNSKAAFVHVPSNSRPRDKDGNTVEQYSEGYLVDVYEQGVVVRGVDFVSGEFMPDYEYVMSVDNNPVASANAIILSTMEVSIDAGASTTVEVTLDAPANAVVNVAANNSNVTVSPASLTFTEGNYNVPQTITITGASSVDNNASAVVTLSADGFTNRTISVTLGEIALTDIVSGANQIVDGAAYGGHYSGSSLNFPNAGSFHIKFVNLNMENTNATVLMKGNPIDGTIEVYGTSTLHSTNSRGISSSSTTPINLIGVGSGASLTSVGDSSTSAGCKGDYNITNLDLSITTAKTPIDIINKGITIIANGSVTMNTAKVKVLTSEHGTLSVNLGAATAGSSAITIASTPDSGYKLSSILINGVAGNATQTMPAAGETMTIQGVFVIDDGQQEPEPGPEEPSSTVIELPWVDNMQAQTGATAEVENTSCMTTMEYIPIESGYSYEVSTTTLGTLGLRVFFYTGTNYTNYLNRSIDIGTDIFPTQYSYTLIIPAGATHLRLRAKTNGDHQTWKDRIVLTKIKNT